MNITAPQSRVTSMIKRLRNHQIPQKIDKELYRYPGQKPNSKETALLMLADGCEARVKAESPKNRKKLKKSLQKILKML